MRQGASRQGWHGLFLCSLLLAACAGGDGATGPAGPWGPTGPGITWVTVTGTSAQAAANTGYLADNAAEVTITLPATLAVGDVVRVSGVGTGGWKIAQNAGQSIVTTNVGRTYWTARDSMRTWSDVASSADGMHLVATVCDGRIYTSADAGVTWTARASVQPWFRVASSADGIRLVAIPFGGFIHTSADGGTTWTQRGVFAFWNRVASSSDGTRLVALLDGGQVYTSVTSGVSWTLQPLVAALTEWRALASSADGSLLFAMEGFPRLWSGIGISIGVR